MLELSDSKRDVLVPAPLSKPPVEMAPTSPDTASEGRTIPVFLGTIPNPIKHSWSVVGVGTFPSFTATRAQRGPITHGFAHSTPDPRLPDYSPHNFKIGYVQMFSRAEIERTRETVRHLWWRVRNLNGGASPGYGSEIDYSQNRFYDLAAKVVEWRRGGSTRAGADSLKAATPQEARTIDMLKREGDDFLSRLAEQPRLGSMPHDVPVGCMIWLEELEDLESAYLRQNSFEYGSGKYPTPLVPMKPEWAALLQGFTTTFEAKREQINREARGGGKVR